MVGPCGTCREGIVLPVTVTFRVLWLSRRIFLQHSWTRVCRGSILTRITFWKFFKHSNIVTTSLKDIQV